MGLKILRISFLFYDEIMNSLCLKYQKEGLVSYQEKLQKIFDSYYMYFDGFSFAMRSIGYLAQEIFYDFKELQFQWARERGFLFSENWKEEILLRQIQEIKPDILYFQDINALPVSILKDVKKRFSFIKQVIIFRGYPLVNKQLFEKLSLADILLVGSPKLLAPCKNQGLKPELHYHSFDPRILEHLERKEEVNFSFCGSSGYGNYFFHLSRFYFLKDLMEKTELQVWVEENEAVLLSPYRKIKRKLKSFIYPFFATLSPKVLEKIERSMCIPEKFCYSAALVKEYTKEERSISFPKSSLNILYPNKCFPPLFGLELYQRLHSSKISLNKHALVAAPFVDNLRLFDSTGVGSCLLTERGNNLQDLFLEDEEVVCYSTKEECIEKLRFLQKHENIRKAIALKGQVRTLRDHNPIKRAEKLDRMIKRKLAHLS